MIEMRVNEVNIISLLYVVGIWVKEIVKVEGYLYSQK